MPDNINHPAHYETGQFECIEVMIETQGVESVQNFCVCNAFKYLYRAPRKNGLEDIKKAIWYLNKYVELTEKALCEKCFGASMNDCDTCYHEEVTNDD